MTRAQIRDAEMCAKADARFELARNLCMDGHEADADWHWRVGWRMCRKAWKARARRLRVKAR